MRRSKTHLAAKLQRFCSGMQADEIALCAAILIAILQARIQEERG